VITIRRADQRGRTRLDWLDSRHTFSFSDYYDPEQMGFRSLRVINDDRVAPGAGFGTHSHRDMEILTYVLEGALEHRDSLGTGSVIRRGDLQRMSAGTGIRHSEFNPSPSEPVHFLQIWLLPERAGLRPGYEQRHFSDADKRGQLRLVAARDGREGAVTIHQDVDLYAALLDTGQAVRHRLRDGRAAWVQLATGGVTLNGQRLTAGDGAAGSGEPVLELVGTEPAEVLLFDLNQEGEGP
jgi:redox-sensitive bicupin YhaK (pirin superfamily)